LIAGSGIAGYWDGNGDPYQARYNYPRGITAIKNASGLVEALLIADTDNNMIRMLLPPAGDNQWRPEYFSGSGDAGYADGDAKESQYNYPQGIAVGVDGFIYVADTYNNAVRRVDREGNTSTYYPAVPTRWGGIAPVGIVASELSEGVWISDEATHSIYRVVPGIAELIAGSGGPGFSDGVGTAASFNAPYHMARFEQEAQEYLYVCDLANQRVRLVNTKTQEVSTLAGSGLAGYVNATASSAQFDLPSGIAIGPRDEVYVIERGNNSIRKVE
jgi:hypothetical protein